MDVDWIGSVGSFLSFYWFIFHQNNRLLAPVCAFTGLLACFAPHTFLFSRLLL